MKPATNLQGYNVVNLSSISSQKPKMDFATPDCLYVRL